jgi:UDP-N-acetylmuramoyl-tripeptide--D-alanyl-D-alanine ligase
MTALWTWDALVRASGGSADGDAPAHDITGFSIDTRSIAPGDVFVALKDARDGHEFVPNAFKAGAAAALVVRTYERKPGDGALLRVDDPLKGLEAIGRAARARLSRQANVIAVTGSAGKTGTKEMLRACLSPLGRTHAPEKSFNNHWGVPLTLARMPADTRYAVIEIGMNHAGEITPLTAMTRPNIAIVTNVLPVHVGNFADGEIGVAKAKAEIFSGLEHGGVAIIPLESAHYARLDAAARAAGAATVAFGTTSLANPWSKRLVVGQDETRVTVSIDDVEADYVVGAPGRHLAVNSLAVAAALHILDVDISSALSPLAHMKAPAGRGARSVIATASGSILLIDESYNANPASMKAALDALGLVPRAAHPRRVVVLGDMRELGMDAPRHHLGLKDAVDAAAADLVFACGEHMKGLYDRLPPAQQSGWGAKSTDIADRVAAALRPGDVVMVKGSLGTNMAPIVAAVRGLGHR